MKHRHKKKSYGGEVGHGRAYNAEGTPAMKSAKDTTDDGFKKGGAIQKKKTGGLVAGAAPKVRLDKRARGGSVMSAGHSLKGFSNTENSKAGSMPPNEP